MESTGASYHTLQDWGLAIGNNDYIGEPEQKTDYVDVMGRDGLLDLSEALTGRPIFSSRPLHILLGGIRERMNWDLILSDFRNKIEGKVIQVIFDNSIDFFWRGRAHISGFDRVRRLGSFTLDIPQAEPYKYEVLTSMQDWIWDIFCFETGVIRTIGRITVDHTSILIPKGNMLTVPVITVIQILSDNFRVQFEGKEYHLVMGRNRFPQILIAGQEEKVLQFIGKGVIEIEYRGGSL